MCSVLCLASSTQCIFRVHPCSRMWQCFLFTAKYSVTDVPLLVHTVSHWWTLGLLTCFVFVSVPQITQALPALQLSDVALPLPWSPLSRKCSQFLFIPGFWHGCHFLRAPALPGAKHSVTCSHVFSQHPELFLCGTYMVVCNLDTAGSCCIVWCPIKHVVHCQHKTGAS